MNAERLQMIFHNYVDQFDRMNAPYPGGDETFKWRVAFGFKSRMDELLLSPPERMYEKMSDLIGGTSVLLNNHYEWPGNALAEYCKTDAETVRTLLRGLFAEDAVRTTGPDEGFDAFCWYREYEFLKNAAGWIPQPVKQFGRRRNMVPKPSEDRQHRAFARSGRGYRHKNLRPAPPKEKDGKAYRFGV